MNDVEKIEKQLVRVSLPKYMAEELDRLAQTYSVTRSEIATDALRSYLVAQKIIFNTTDTGMQYVKQ